MGMNVNPCASDAWAGIYVHAVDSECANLREGGNCSTLSCEFNNRSSPGLGDFGLGTFECPLCLE